MLSRGAESVGAGCCAPAATEPTRETSTVPNTPQRVRSVRQGIAALLPWVMCARSYRQIAPSAVPTICAHGSAALRAADAPRHGSGVWLDKLERGQRIP